MSRKDIRLLTKLSFGLTKLHNNYIRPLLVGSHIVGQLIGIIGPYNTFNFGSPGKQCRFQSGKQLNTKVLLKLKLTWKKLQLEWRVY